MGFSTSGFSESSSVSTPRDPTRVDRAQSEGDAALPDAQCGLQATLYFSHRALWGYCSHKQTNPPPNSWKPEKGQRNPNVTAELFLNEMSLVVRESLTCRERAAINSSACHLSLICGARGPHCVIWRGSVNPLLEISTIPWDWNLKDTHLHCTLHK